MNHWLCVFLIGVCPNVHALSIEVITDQPNQIQSVAQIRQQGITVTIHDLTAGERMEAELSKGLTGTSEQAQQQLQQRFAAMGRQQLEAQLQTAFKAMIQSVTYHIDRYPAIVFNQGEAVIYGVTDLNQALRLYRQWQVNQ